MGGASPVSGGMQLTTSAPAIWAQGWGRKGGSDAGPTDHSSPSPESPQRPAGRGWPTQLRDGLPPGLVIADTKHLQSEHGDQCWRLTRGTSQGPGYLIMHLGCRKGLAVVGAAVMCLQLPQLPSPPGPLLPILLGLPEGLPGFGWPPTPPSRCPQW